MKYRKNIIRLSWNKYNIFNILNIKRKKKSGFVKRPLRSKSKIKPRLLNIRKFKFKPKFRLKPKWKFKFKSTTSKKFVRRATIYKKQLQAKQQLRFLYSNLREYQFAKLFKLKGITLLETRLDTIIYRMNFSRSLFESRQLINHGHVLVNHKLVNLANYQVTEGDIVQIKPESIPFIKNLFNVPKISNILTVPKFLEVNYKNFSGILISEPKYKEIPLPIKIKLKKIYNFYTRN